VVRVTWPILPRNATLVWYTTLCYCFMFVRPCVRHVNTVARKQRHNDSSVKRKKRDQKKQDMCQVTCSPRPPTLSQRHTDLHMWSHPRHSYTFQFHRDPFRGFRCPGGSKFGHSHYFGCLLLLLYTRWCGVCDEMTSISTSLSGPSVASINTSITVRSGREPCTHSVPGRSLSAYQPMQQQ